MKILSPAYSLKLKNIILLFNRCLIFSWNGHIHNVVSTLPNVVKIDIENQNVVSTLSNVVQFNIELYGIVSTLLNVVNFKVDVRNVVSTLVWRCAMSRRHINLKTTLNRRWNVCWVCILYNYVSYIADIYYRDYSNNTTFIFMKTFTWFGELYESKWKRRPR